MPETPGELNFLPSAPLKVLTNHREKDAFASAVSTYFRTVSQRLVTEHEKDLTLLRQENQSLREELNEAREPRPVTTGDIDEALEPREEWLRLPDQKATEEEGTARGIDADQEVFVEGIGSSYDEIPDGEEGQLDFSNGQHEAAMHLTSISKMLAMQERTHGLYETRRPPPTCYHHTIKHGLTFGLHDKADGNCVERIVFTNTFELMSGAIILANTVVMALQLQYDGLDADLRLNGCHNAEPLPNCIRETAEDKWPGAEISLEICNYGFICLFIVELLLRIAANRWKSIKSGWIWFDAIVVSVGVIDVFAKDALAFNPGMMRAVRLFRLVRLLKVFQAMSSFDSLFLLLKALFASREALVWSFLILGLVQLIVGLFLCQVLQDFLADDKNDIEARRRVYRYFGTFSKTMLTMFEITMANWITSCRVLTDLVSEWFMVFYIAYRCMFCFAVLKVIAAVFITETNRVLESDDELTVMKHNRAELGFRSRLVSLFKRIDPHQTGTLGWSELDELMTDSALAASVTALGFSIHDFEKLFWLLDEGNGKIEIHEFVNKMEKLKGSSKEIDTLTMLKLAHNIDKKISFMMDRQGLLKRSELDEAEEELATRL